MMKGYADAHVHANVKMCRYAEVNVYVGVGVDVKRACMHIVCVSRTSMSCKYSQTICFKMSDSTTAKGLDSWPLETTKGTTPGQVARKPARQENRRSRGKACPGLVSRVHPTFRVDRLRRLLLNPCVFWTMRILFVKTRWLKHGVALLQAVRVRFHGPLEVPDSLFCKSLELKRGHSRLRQFEASLA